MCATAVSGHDDAAYLVRRGRLWQFRRRVPDALVDRDGRREIRLSTGTADRTQAALTAAHLNAALEAHWASLAAETGGESTATTKFAAAVATARTLGLRYQPAMALADSRIDELVARVELLDRTATPASATASLVAAVLGGAELKLSGLVDAYAAIAADRLIGKCPDQLRKWTNPLRRAVTNLTALTGDKQLADITRDDALDFKMWWVDRVRDEGYDRGSANKDLGHLATMMRSLDEAHRLRLTLPFAGIRLAGEKHNPRPAYDPDFVRQRILPGHELDSLNPEARAIVRMVAATGMRPSELVGLMPSRILIDAKIPLLQVRPDTRQIKNDHSARDMPLAGVALSIMQAFPHGFPRYRNSPDTLSATVNKALDLAGLRPTPEHTLYSLRHTFKDRLIAIEAPERVQDALMGHAIREVKYGAGPTLEQRAEWLARVWG